MYCRGCGNPLVVYERRCVFCSTKKGFLQSPQAVAVTRRGAVKKANRALVSEHRRVVRDVQSGAAPLTWQDAERLVCDWMRKNGYRDAALTKSGADGGVDVTSKKAIAQVKFHAKPIGIAEVQRVYGIGVAQRKQRTLIFASAGFTRAAREFADKHGVECYVYPPIRRVGS